jgi:hypothetical protein
MKFLITTLLAFTCSVAQATQPIPLPSCWPTTNLVIPPDAQSGMTEEEFNAVLDDFEVTAKPLVDAEGKGAVIVVKRLWTDNTINASTYPSGNKYIINSYGGFARYPGMTKSAYMMIMCHELGHHLGNAPKYGNNTEWAAIEGQSDYWATLKCYKLFKPLGYDSDEGMKTLATILAKLNGAKTMPSLETPDTTEVKVMSERHPKAQCRLDTSKAGDECEASGDMDEDDPAIGSCHNYDTDKKAVGLGNRPRCWFFPK